MPKLQFWYDFGSTYSYLTAMRIEPLAQAGEVELAWRPFLLGPIFKAAGYDSSPFLEQADKLAYMWRDVERRAKSRGHVFRKPAIFPANGVYASRIALIAADEGWIGAWTRRVFQGVFVDGLDLSQPDVLSRLCDDVGQDAVRIGAAAQDQAIKERLRTQSDEAVRLGLFGAPTFITEDGEMFWGDDRLEDALEWARSGRA